MALTRDHGAGTPHRQPYMEDSSIQRLVLTASLHQLLLKGLGDARANVEVELAYLQMADDCQAARILPTLH